MGESQIIHDNLVGNVFSHPSIVCRIHRIRFLPRVALQEQRLTEHLENLKLEKKHGKKS